MLSVSQLVESVERQDLLTLAKSLSGPFTLIQLSLDHQRFSPLVVDVDGEIAIVAFTSQAAAERFIDKYRVLDQENRLAKTRVFDSYSLFSSRFNGSGLLLEPQSENAILLPSRLLDKLQPYLLEQSWLQGVSPKTDSLSSAKDISLEATASVDLTVRDFSGLCDSLDQTVSEFSFADQTVEELPELSQLDKSARQQDEENYFRQEQLQTSHPLADQAAVPTQYPENCNPPKSSLANDGYNELAVIRSQSLAAITQLGLELTPTAPSLPTALRLRSIEEIAARLLGLGAVFSWVSTSESLVPRTAILRAINSRDLERFISREEREVLALGRSEASQNFSRTIGWKLEYMWPLAWVLGFDVEPTVDVKHIDASTSRQIVHQFLQNMQHSVESLTDRSSLRSNQQVLGLYDLLLCAQHSIEENGWAVSNQTTLDQRQRQAKVVYQRRMALLWCLSPGLAWDHLASKRFTNAQPEN